MYKCKGQWIAGRIYNQFCSSYALDYLERIAEVLTS